MLSLLILHEICLPITQNFFCKTFVIRTRKSIKKLEKAVINANYKPLTPSEYSKTVKLLTSLANNKNSLSTKIINYVFT